MKSQKQYKRILLLLALLSAATFVSAQPFIQKQINRRVSDYNHVGIDQSSPLSYYLSRAYIMAEGKMGLMAKMSTVKFELDTCEVDVVVDSAKKQRILDEKIIKIVIYKDSVAAIVTEYSENWQIFSYTWIENGKWVNGGTTDFDGKYTIELLPGEYELEVTYPWYWRYRRKGVIVPEGEKSVRMEDILLRSNPDAVIDEVEIYGQSIPIIEIGPEGNTNTEIQGVPLRIQY